MTIKAKIMETDSVTGALNRTGFFHKVRKILEGNPEQDYAIAYFNIQRFKTVNVCLGMRAEMHFSRGRQKFLPLAF